LFKAAGQDLARLRAAAGRPGFRAVPLDASASIELASRSVEKHSRNVLGLLPGSEKPDEAIVYMAHWDHLGTHEGETGDAIYNGAVDNATGVAGILEIAEALRKAPTPPKRSVLFLAVTLEESGLLGSKYYVAHPVIPLAQTVAVINLDAMAPVGKARDLTVVGKGSSQLEDLLKAATDRQKRRLVEESHPAAGYYFRSDHFNFAKAGVPALYIGSGSDLVEGGAAAGEAASRDYNEQRYHKPGDQYDPASWKLDGIVEDLEAVRSVGETLANSGQWPNWRDGNPFKAARDAARPTATTIAR
jgi:Zn-dependent M28 family amino/carboxypeptidase